MASRGAFLVLSFVALGAGCAPRAATARPTVLPKANLQSLDRGGGGGGGGGDQELTAALGGRPALLSLWATWCDACQKETLELERLDGWAREHGGVVMGVAVGEPVAKVKAFVAEHRMAYAILVDEEFRLSDALGEKRVPATLVIDRSGRIVYTGGALDERSMGAFRALF